MRLKFVKICNSEFIERLKTLNEPNFFEISVSDYSNKEEKKIFSRQLD